MKVHMQVHRYMHGGAWRFTESLRYMEVHEERGRCIKVHKGSWSYMEMEVQRCMEVHGVAWRSMEVHVHVHVHGGA